MAPGGSGRATAPTMTSVPPARTHQSGCSARARSADRVEYDRAGIVAVLSDHRHAVAFAPRGQLLSRDRTHLLFRLSAVELQAEDDILVNGQVPD